jgi:hypothetical protein
LPRQLDFAGKSGTVYRYTILEEDRVLPPAGANYVIAKVSDRGAKIVFAGETDNLSSGAWRRKFEEARKRFGATDILMRLNVRSSTRQQEQDDLIEAHQPPMNGGPVEEAGEEA